MPLFDLSSPFLQSQHSHLSSICCFTGVKFSGNKEKNSRSVYSLSLFVETPSLGICVEIEFVDESGNWDSFAKRWSVKWQNVENFLKKPQAKICSRQVLRALISLPLKADSSKKK
ncbi:hypothetical protein YC2023_091028 [Brassica napus]